MSDMETGYKLIKKKHLDKINLKEKSFGIEPELTVKLAKKNLVFYEVPISYKGRTYQEGKKIGFKDAVVASVQRSQFSIGKDSLPAWLRLIAKSRR